MSQRVEQHNGMKKNHLNVPSIQPEVYCPKISHLTLSETTKRDVTVYICQKVLLRKLILLISKPHLKAEKSGQGAPGKALSLSRSERWPANIDA